MADREQPGAPRPALRLLAFALVLVLTLQLAVWGAFLVPLRVGEVLVPVSWLLAAIGNLALGWAGARLVGRAGAALPGALWLAVALVLGSRRAEGDDLFGAVYLAGLVYLVTGALSSAVVYGFVQGRATAAPPGQLRAGGATSEAGASSTPV